MGARSSNKHWARLFVALLVLSMVEENLQVAVRCKVETDMGEGIVYPSNYATSTIGKMDETLESVIKLFRFKYHMDGKGRNGFNPIKNVGDREQLKEVSSRTLAHQVQVLIDQYSKLSQ